MKFQEAAVQWATEELTTRSDVPFTRIDHVNFSVSSYTACDTCGPETQYKADIYYENGDQKPRYGKFLIHTHSFYGLDDILQRLFAMTEPRS